MVAFRRPFPCFPCIWRHKFQKRRISAVPTRVCKYVFANCGEAMLSSGLAVSQHLISEWAASYGQQRRDLAAARTHENDGPFRKTFLGALTFDEPFGESTMTTSEEELLPQFLVPGSWAAQAGLNGRSAFCLGAVLPNDGPCLGKRGNRFAATAGSQ